MSVALARAATIIDDAPELALACHHHPDGDALGSLLGMHLLSSANGKPSVASWPEPFVAAPHYQFLPGLDSTTSPTNFPDEPGVMVTFDTGNLARLGNLAPSAEHAGQLVVLDHHADNSRFGTVNAVEIDAAATAVVVHRLASILDWHLTRDAAICLYVGLVTDTGRFQYPNTTTEVFELAERLSSFGLPLADITRELYEKHRFAYIQLAANSLARAVLDADRKFVAGWITAAEFDHWGVTFDESEGFIDLLRRTSEATVACAIREADGEGLRVSLRSVDGTDVAEVARELGGGGHEFMSGFISQWSVDETIERIKALLPS